MQTHATPGRNAMHTILGIVAALLAACAVFVVITMPAGPHATPVAATNLDAARTCTQDTGGTCRMRDCYPWRKHATCSWGKCICPKDMCAYQGSCVSPSDLPPSPPPVCHMETGESCAVLGCGNHLFHHEATVAKCSGLSFGFSSFVSLGKCICPEGTCAVDGKCTGKPRPPPANLDAKNIACPVLASLYNAGFFQADPYGRVERINLQAGIRDGLGTDDFVAYTFGLTTAGYTKADVDEQNFQMVNVKKANELKAAQATEAPLDMQRFLNIFRMVQNKDVLHQIGAAVRGGPNDPECTKWPCIQRFNQFFANFADAKGRIYAKQMGDIAGNIYRNGYHGVATESTLFTNLLGSTGREYLALAGFMACFGQLDANKQRYVPIEWARDMFMNGVFPAEWTKRGPGSPQGNTWSREDVLGFINTWREQGVPGVSGALKLRTFLGAHNILHSAPTSEGSECDVYLASTGCGWTAKWSCPGKPRGSMGFAKDDGTHGYDCCCNKK